MQTLTIKATSEESARGFVNGLAGFQVELHESADGSCLVEIALGGPDCEIVAVLNALEDYVSRRGEGPAEVDLSGRSYKLHPADPLPAT